MEIMLRKPYLTSWLAIPSLILLGIIFNRHTIDIQLADTYYVIDKLHFSFLASLFLLVVGAGYWLLSQRENGPNRLLTAIHLLLTLAALVTFALPLSTGTWLAWVATTLLVSQVLYVVNIFIVLLLRNSSSVNARRL